MVVVRGAPRLRNPFPFRLARRPNSGAFPQRRFFWHIRFRKIRIHATLQIMVKQTSGELLQREDLESCAIPEPLKKFLAEVA
jgi:hypothetical protein